MDGVEILNTIESGINGKAIFYLICCLIMGIMLLIGLICVIKWKECSALMFIFFALLFLFCMFLSIVLCGLIKTPAQQQVTISEDVKFSEFQEKYKIIKQDGKIFTVEERKK